jgi:hypothetical protein
MRKFMLMLLLAGMSIVAACQTPRETTWYKSGASEAELRQDRAQCELNAEKAISSANDLYTNWGKQGYLMKTCMIGKGYQIRDVEIADKK